MASLFLYSILTSCLMCVTFGDMTDGSNQEFNPDGFERISLPDQNQDSVMFGDSEPFGSQNQAGNYFMYQHVPKKGHYDFAYKRGNEHHVKEHHEKAAPHKGHFKIQARWGDKHGGYGEQYWDYNHGGDGHDEHIGEDINGESSRNVQSPSISPLPSHHSVDTSSSAEIPDAEKMEPVTRHPKRKPFKRGKKLHDGAPKRKTKIVLEDYDKPSNSDESNVFTIPKAYPTSVYPIGQQETTKSSRNNEPYRIDLYEHLRNMPSTYEHSDEEYSTSSNSRSGLKAS